MQVLSDNVHTGDCPKLNGKQTLAHAERINRNVVMVFLSCYDAISHISTFHFKSSLRQKCVSLHGAYKRKPLACKVHETISFSTQVVCCVLYLRKSYSIISRNGRGKKWYLHRFLHMEVIFPHQGPISPNINKQKCTHRLKTNLSPIIKKFVDNKYVVSSPMISAAAE